MTRRRRGALPPRAAPRAGAGSPANGFAHGARGRSAPASRRTSRARRSRSSAPAWTSRRSTRSWTRPGRTRTARSPSRRGSRAAWWRSRRSRRARSSPLERRRDIVVGKREARRRAARARAPAAARRPRPPRRARFRLTAHVVVPRNLFVKSDEPADGRRAQGRRALRARRHGGLRRGRDRGRARAGASPSRGRTFDDRARAGRSSPGGRPRRPCSTCEARYDNPAAVVTVTVQGPLDEARDPARRRSRRWTRRRSRSSSPPGGPSSRRAPAASARSPARRRGGRRSAALATQAFNEPRRRTSCPSTRSRSTPGALRAGKYVTDKIYVGYVRRFDADPERGENVDEVRVEYQITPRWTFESRYGNAQSGGASLIWSRDY